MKKKLFLLALMVALFACLLAISVSAKDISTGYSDLEGNEIVVPTYDSEGNSLVWVRSTMLNRAEQYGIALTNGKNYYEISDNGTTYYIFGQKSKEAFSVNDSYILGIVKSRGVSSDTILVANFDGLVHKDGTGAQQFGFSMRNNIIKYVYIQSSFKSTKNPNDSNKQIFLGSTALEVVEFAPGSQITELGASAFKQCAIAEIVLPEGLTYIDERAFDACTSLKKIYIPRTVTFIDEIAFNGVTDAEYYFTGSEETTSGWEITNEIQYVNHCDVYYGGEHACEDDGDCTTPLICDTCGKVFEADISIHKLQMEVKYDNGYANEGYKRNACTICNSFVASEEKLTPIFECLGYSTNDDNSGIATGFNINHDALSEYEEISGKKITFGIVVFNPKYLGTDTIFNADGKINASKGALQVELDLAYAHCKLCVSGMSLDNEEHTALELVFAGYAYEGEDKANIQVFQKEYLGTQEAPAHSPMASKVTRGNNVLYTIKLQTVLTPTQITTGKEDLLEF